VTFILGTNYPYYFVDKNGQLEKRVDGNPFLQFFAGPGIVYTDCSHGAYVSDSLSNNRVFEPGLNFSGTFDQPPRLIDLRPQLRTFTVEALTKDDITIRVDLFVHFKIDTGHQVAKLGHPFPISQKAVYLAVTSDLIERMGKQDKDKKHTWDDRLVCLIATPIVQDIISGYTVAELCGSADPRVKIAEAMVEKVTNALQPLGLKVISGGIDNLVPQDKLAVEERLDNWRAEWERRNIPKQIGPDKHTYLLELERAKTEAELIKRLAKVARESGKSGNSLLLRLIDSLGEIMGPSKKP
jgi:regulator of protease activity HflC (stomatin/prohibitin superfamily)